MLLINKKRMQIILSCVLVSLIAFSLKTGEVKKVGIEIGADQRLLLRSMCRFAYNFEVLSRGYGKTTFELLAIYIMAILYPRTTWSMSAQTLQTSAGFFSDKHADIMQFYPIIAQEIDGKVKIFQYILGYNGTYTRNYTEKQSRLY